MAVFNLFFARFVSGASDAATPTPTVAALASTAPVAAPVRPLPKAILPPTKPASVFTAALAPISCLLVSFIASKSPESLGVKSLTVCTLLSSNNLESSTTLI